MSEHDLAKIAEAEHERTARFSARVFCCVNTGCLSCGSGRTLDALREATAQRGLGEQVEVVPSGCLGLCSRGPLVRLEKADGSETFFQKATSDVAEALCSEALNGDGATTTTARDHRLPTDIPFFERQQRIVLANAGHIDPERIEAYIARGGYAALAKVVHEMTPDEVCAMITKSGLRGRGGAGYPTGVKWNLVRKTPADNRYVIANGDEGDPGAYMDRTVMEDDPHRVLEGMAIAAYAIGADSGYVYVRGEYPAAVRRLDLAAKAARRHGLLGRNILGTKFSLSLEVRIGAGAFVCGEETALIASVEGGRGQPRPRPPYPAEHGLYGSPTLINNVETFANIAAIVNHGPEWFASIGTAGSKGTKVFALAGALVNTGLVEVPMGTTLRAIVDDIGGGVSGGKQCKAVQTGGPSGGCIPAHLLDLPVDYESLQQVGSIMGSGGMIVIDDSASMIELARFFVEFCRDESCGKCIPCRVGTVQMHRLLDRIATGSGTMDDLDLLEELCDMVQHTSLCGLGQTAPNPVVSTLRYFREEYLAKIGNRRRPAGPKMASLPIIQLPMGGL